MTTETARPLYLHLEYDRSRNPATCSRTPIATRADGVSVGYGAIPASPEVMVEQLDSVTTSRNAARRLRRNLEPRRVRRGDRKHRNYGRASREDQADDVTSVARVQPRPGVNADSSQRRRSRAASPYKRRPTGRAASAHDRDADHARTPETARLDPRQRRPFRRNLCRRRRCPQCYARAPARPRRASDPRAETSTPTPTPTPYPASGPRRNP